LYCFDDANIKQKTHTTKNNVGFFQVYLLKVFYSVAPIGVVVYFAYPMGFKGLYSVNNNVVDD
jgi:hypothetical protein